MFLKWNLNVYLNCFYYSQLIHKYNIYHIIFSLYNVHSVFQNLFFILREFQNLYFAKLHKFLELKLLKLQFHKIIRVKYYLVITKWYSIVCATLEYLVKEVCLCGCIYNLRI